MVLFLFFLCWLVVNLKYTYFSVIIFFFYNYKMTIVNNINFLYSLYFIGLFDTLRLCLIVLLNRFYKICGLYYY